MIQVCWLILVYFHDLKPMAVYGDPAYPLRVRSRTEVLE